MSSITLQTKAAHAAGLSAAQMLLLMAVDCYGVIDCDDGEKIGVHGAALSSLLDSLAARDLVHWDDGGFRLTEDGAALIERSHRLPANDTPSDPVATSIDTLTRMYAEDAGVQS